MTKVTRNFLLIGLIILLTPFLYIIRYAELSGDDFTRAVMDINDFSLNYSDWFFTHNGRFINGMLSILPLYGGNMFKVILLINFLALPFVIRILLKRFFILSEIDVDNSVLNISTLILTFLMIIQLPLPVEFFYWISSMTVYSFSLLCFLLFIYGLLRVKQNMKNAVLIAALFSLLAIGNNEIFILLNNYITFVFITHFYLKFGKFSGKLVIIQIVSLVSGLLVILGPGSKSRQSNFEDGGNILGSIILSLKNTVSLIMNQFLNLGDILVLLMIIFLSILIVYSNRSNNLMRSINIIKLGSISVGAIFLIILTPNYAMGGISYNEGRLGNLIQILLLLIFFVNILNLCIRKKNSFSFFLKKTEILYFVISMALILNVLISDNYLNLFEDFRNSSFHKQEIGLINRVENLKHTNESNILLKKRYKSKTLDYEELTGNKEHWYNRSYTFFLNSKYNLSLESIIVVKENNK